MNRVLLLVALSLAVFACLAPALATPAPASTPTAQSVNKAALVTINEPAETLGEACTFQAVTDTNLREWASVTAPIVGEIEQGEFVTAICTVGGQWANVPHRGWFCIAALSNNGKCSQ